MADSGAKPKQLLNKVVEKSGEKKRHPKTLVTSKLNKCGNSTISVTECRII